MSTEADTCRKFVVAKLQAAGWNFNPHSIAGRRGFTDAGGEKGQGSWRWPGCERLD